MKKNGKKLSSLLVGAAVAGLMTATTTLASCSGGDTAAAERNGCNGPNGCGGHGKKDTNGCNGPNGCKGQDAKKEVNGCNGPNGCNGHGTKPAKN
ncbi:MAG TPA: hypothetical protein VFZ65_02860 [Planctomycetota bacterium]|nr:hypothetical protein [Planctomycetota bacterium]